MNFLKLISLIFLLSSCAYSTTKDSAVMLRGVIRHSDSNAYDHVVIDMGYREIKVKEDGSFCFNHIHPDGSVFLKFSAEGRKPVEIKLDRGSYFFDVFLADYQAEGLSTISATRLPEDAPNQLECR